MRDINKEGVVFLNLVKKIFKKYQGLKSFSWTQYTPYFDLDSYFNANIHDISINGVFETNSKLLQKVSKEISYFLDKYDNYFYLHMFGDHANITVNSEDLNIDDYDHE
jgi:hypothetical protein